VLAAVVDSPVTLDDAALATGLDPAMARRLWRATGLPEPPPDVEVSDDDSRILVLLADAVASGSSPEAVVQLVRVMGAALTRVAEAEAGSTPDASALERHVRLVAALHRRHLDAAVERRQNRGPAGSPVTVGFVDLVGFTAISRRLDDVELSDLLSRFETLAHDVVASHGGRVVKTIGDEAMFVIEQPAAAVEAALELAAAHADDAHLPDVHIGIAYGPALARDGDYFGAVVNLGRRITDIAPAGAVVVSEEMRAAMGGELGFEWKSLGPRDLKDIGATMLWTVRPAWRPDSLRVLESLARGDIDVDQALALIPS